MIVRVITVVAFVGGGLSVGAPAVADYQGLHVTGGLANVGGTLRNVWQVWAAFTDPNDYLTSVFGDSAWGTLTIQSRNATDTGLGSNFFNPISSHANSPSLLELNGGTDGDGNPIPPVPGAAFDTFATIGIFNQGQANPAPNPGADDATSFSPGFPANFISGNSFVTANSGWFTLGPAEQGRAGFVGDGDPSLRVLIMQLTVSSTSHVRGTVNISGVNNTPLAGESFVVGGQSFSSVPSPATVPILVAVGLIGSRRRRCKSARIDYATYCEQHEPHPWNREHQWH